MAEEYEPPKRGHRVTREELTEAGFSVYVDPNELNPPIYYKRGEDQNRGKVIMVYCETDSGLIYKGFHGLAKYVEDLIEEWESGKKDLS